MNKQQFVQYIYDSAYKRLRQLGKSEADASFYARMLASQACLESDFGNRETGTYNYFGLKAAPNQNGKVVTTHEFSGKKKIKIEDSFLNFNSLEDGVNIAVGRLDSKFHAFNGQLTPKSYVDTIHKYGYFTDEPSSYLKKINGVLKGSVLPAALNGHSNPKVSNPFGFTIPSQPLPSIVHPNDATKVEKPFIMKREGYLDLQEVERAKALVKKMRM